MKKEVKKTMETTKELKRLVAEMRLTISEFENMEATEEDLYNMLLKLDDFFTDSMKI